MPEDKPKLKVLDLFSGILLGGFSLGLERTGGFETVAFCEIEPFPRRVLAKHWPKVPCYEDVRTLTADTLVRDGIGVDVITGGFPCQDLSVAGRRAGLGGERSGLWSEIVRLIRELSPRYVIVENVANLLSGPSEKRGGWFGRVLGDLAECGYDSFWKSIPASYVGAPHNRNRIWIVAHPKRIRQPFSWEYIRAVNTTPGAYREANRLVNVFQSGTLPFVCRGHDGLSEELDRGLSDGQHKENGPNQTLPGMPIGNGQKEVFNGPSRGPWEIFEPQVLQHDLPGKGAGKGRCYPQANHDVEGEEAQVGFVRELRSKGKASHSPYGQNNFKQQPQKSNDALCSVPQPSPCGVDRLKGLGNAVVPQIPELIGNAILAAHRETA